MKATSTGRGGYSCYGRRGYRSADPTPDEIKQRIAEVHRIRRERDAKRTQRRDAMQRIVLAAIATTGPMTVNSLAMLIDYSHSKASEMLTDMAAIGLVARDGNGKRSAYVLPEQLDDESTGEPELLPNDVLFQRVVSRRFSAA